MVQSDVVMKKGINRKCPVTGGWWSSQEKTSLWSVQNARGNIHQHILYIRVVVCCIYLCCSEHMDVPYISTIEIGKSNGKCSFL